MIRITARPEYAGFNRHVRAPGEAFLETNPTPNSYEFSRNCFWTRAKPELQEAYGHICAYTCIYLVEQGTIDHFLPKSIYHHLAYEWSNFRLARKRANECKGAALDIMDPFEIQNGWFVLQLPSCQILAHPGLSHIHKDRVNTTIRRLRLNDEDVFVQERCDIILAYGLGDLSLDFLRRRYPFLALEIERQGIEDRVMNFFTRR